MDYTSLLPAVAFGLDLALGDPQRWPHPVRLIGAALTRLEPLAAKLSPPLKRLYGLAVALGLCACVYALVLALVRLPGLGWLFSIYLAFAGLALGQLLREARSVSGLITSGRLDDARRELSYLVSRDTSVLDEAGSVAHLGRNAQRELLRRLRCALYLSGAWRTATVVGL